MKQRCEFNPQQVMEEWFGRGLGETESEMNLRKAPLDTVDLWGKKYDINYNSFSSFTTNIK